MKLTSTVLASLLCACATFGSSIALADPVTIYLTRHAEKASTGTDPALTPDGVIRAKNIAAILKNANIKHVYSTTYARTQQTAQPLATYLGLPVTAYDSTQQATFAQQLRALPDNSLVVGHSDTVPELIRQLGGETISVIPETEFDRLYQVSITHDGIVTTNRLTSIPSTLTVPSTCPVVTMNQTNVTAAVNTWVYFTINVPECANTLTINMSGGTGDGDMHTKFGAQPTATDYKCRPYKTGNVESCVETNPAAGTWYIGIKAYKAFTGVTLSATATE